MILQINDNNKNMESMERDHPIAYPEQVLFEIDNFKEYLVKPVDLEREEYAIYKHILKHYAEHIMQQQLQAKLKRLKHRAEIDKEQRRANPPQRETKLKHYEKTAIVLMLLINQKNWHKITIQQLCKSLCCILVRSEASMKKILNQFQFWFEPTEFFVVIGPKVKGKVRQVPEKYLTQIGKNDRRKQRKIARMQKKAQRQTKNLRIAKQKLSAHEDQVQNLKQRIAYLERGQMNRQSQQSPKNQPYLGNYQEDMEIIDKIQEDQGILIGSLIREQYMEDVKESKEKLAVKKELREKNQQNRKLKQQLKRFSVEYVQFRKKNSEKQKEIAIVEGALKASQQALATSQKELAERVQQNKIVEGALKGSKQARTETQQQPLDLQMLEKLTPRSVVKNRPVAKRQKDEPFSFEKKH